MPVTLNTSPLSSAHGVDRTASSVPLKRVIDTRSTLSSQQKESKSGCCLEKIADAFRSFWKWLCSLCKKEAVKEAVKEIDPKKSLAAAGTSYIDSHLKLNDASEVRAAVIINVNGEFADSHFGMLNKENLSSFRNAATQKLQQALDKTSISKDTDVEVFTFLSNNPKNGQLVTLSRQNDWCNVPTSTSSRTGGGRGMPIEKMQVKWAIGYVLGACRKADTYEKQETLINFMFHDFRKDK